LFFARGFGNFLNGNPPLMQDVTLQFGTLQSLAGALTSTPRPGPQVLGWQYDSPYPKDTQWSGGAQVMLPFATVFDAAYVGHHSWDELYPLNLGAIDLGAAFLPQNQDRTLAASATPGASAVVTQLMAPLRGYNNVWLTTNLGWRTYHGLQLSVQHRLSRGVQFGLNDTIHAFGSRVLRIRRLPQHAAAAHAAQHGWQLRRSRRSVAAERSAGRHADATPHSEGDVPVDAAEHVQRRARRPRE
jgi:hypothetical protein